MNPSLPRLAAHLTCASLLASCGGASAPTGQSVAVVLPPPPPSPDPPAAEPEPTVSPPAPAKASAPALTARPSAPPAQPINAPPPSSQSIAAEALFREGRQLMAQGDFAKACPKFEESNRLDPAIGTLFNLAACEERAGKKTQACAHYIEVAQLTQQSGQQDRMRLAQEKAQNLGCPP